MPIYFARGKIAPPKESHMKSQPFISQLEGENETLDDWLDNHQDNVCDFSWELCLKLLGAVYTIDFLKH